MPRKMEDQYISQAEFARRLGITRQAVYSLIKNGTIRLSKKHDKKINYDVMKKAYENNRNLSQVRNNKPKKSNPKAKKSYKKNSDDEYVKPIKPIYKLSNKDKIPLNTYDEYYDDDGSIPVVGTYADNQNRKISADADRIQLAYAKELGKVLPTEVALLVAGDKMRSIKEAMLSMPSKTTGLIVADVKTKVEVWKEGELELLSNSISNILKSSVEDVLAALSASSDSLPKDVEAYFESKR